MSHPNAVLTEVISSITDATESSFVPTFFLCLPTIIDGMHNYGRPDPGNWLIVTERVLFWTYVAITFLQSIPPILASVHWGASDVSEHDTGVAAAYISNHAKWHYRECYLVKSASWPEDAHSCCWRCISRLRFLICDPDLCDLHVSLEAFRRERASRLPRADLPISTDCFQYSNDGVWSARSQLEARHVHRSRSTFVHWSRHNRHVEGHTRRLRLLYQSSNSSRSSAPDRAHL